jgi:hypothetical protein
LLDKKSSDAIKIILFKQAPGKTKGLPKQNYGNDHSASSTSLMVFAVARPTLLTPFSVSEEALNTATTEPK